MKIKKLVISVLLAGSLLQASFIVPAAHVSTAIANAAEALPNVKILATGGTIAGVASSNTQTTGYSIGSTTIDTLIKAVPEMKGLANVSGEQIANVGSPDITNETLLKLAKRINQLLATPDVDGIVVTHGTDTMEETAYFLNLVVKSKKPVVVVGAMRPSTAISADGPFNLYNAVKLAGSKEAAGKGVMVLINDRISAARAVTKTHTTSLDTFKSLEEGYLGMISGNKILFYNEPSRKHTVNTRFNITYLDSLPQVDIIYSHQTDGTYLYEAAVKAGAKGIVIAGSGDGSLSKQGEAGAKAAKSKGTAIVRSTRVASGTVTHSAADDEKGFVTSDSLNPQKARILLMLALVYTDDPAEIQQFFDTY